MRQQFGRAAAAALFGLSGATCSEASSTRPAHSSTEQIFAAEVAACSARGSCDGADAVELLQQRAKALQASAAGAEAPPTMRDINQLFSGAGQGSKESWRLASEFAERDFEAQRIQSSEVAESMAYAKAGSSIPSSLHGIFWLDQYHQSSIAKGDAYIEAKPFKHPPSDETLASFGDVPTAWEPQSRCVGPTPNYGGVRGHWTYLDTPGGRLQLEGAISSRMTANMCFDESMQTIDVDAGVRVPILGNYVVVPSWLFAMRMERRSWGWNRVTTVGPNISTTMEKFGPMLEKVLPEEMMAILRMGTAGAFQYPAIQIIDGEGRKTKYFQEYMDFITGEYNDFKLTQLVGKVTETFQPKFLPSCYAATGNSCSDRACGVDSMSTCRAGQCVCKNDRCAGPDGICHNARNELVHSGFTLRNAKWPDEYLYVKRFTLSQQFEVTKVPSLKDGQDKLSLYRVVGQGPGVQVQFILASDRWDQTVAAMQPNEGNSLTSEEYGLFAEDMEAKGKTNTNVEDLSLAMCIVPGSPDVLMLGRLQTPRAFAYLKWNSWLVHGMEFSQALNATEAHWIPDPPLPKGKLAFCNRNDY